MRQWYSLTAQAADDPKTADLYVYDLIGRSFWDDETVTAKKFIDDLHALPKETERIRVHVNSPGGNPFDATTIANALRAESRDKKRTIETMVEGLAASAATLITCAGDSIKMADNAIMMVHNPLAGVLGHAKDMRKMADDLDKVRDSIIATYRWVSHLSAEKISALMDETTWMSAEEAVKNGFATEVMSAVEVTNKFSVAGLAALPSMPEDMRARVVAMSVLVPPESEPQPKPQPKPPEVADAKYILAACEGFSSKLAGMLLDQPRAVVDARVAHAKEVVNLCKANKLDDLAEGYILANTPVETVKHHLTVVTAKMDKIEIDTSHSGGTVAPRAIVSAAEIFERRRQESAQVGAGR